MMPNVPVLEGVLVRLEHLSSNHAADLAAAAEENRGTYGFSWVPTAAQVDDYLRDQFDRVRAGSMVALAQIRREDGRAVGCTAFWNPRTWPENSYLCAVEIGFTWLGASAQGTGINTESKLLWWSTHSTSGTLNELI